MTEQGRRLLPELITEREVLEGLQPEGLVDLIIAHGEKVGAYERTMNLAADVLEGVYGLTVESVLDARKKEKQNVQT